MLCDRAADAGGLDHTLEDLLAEDDQYYEGEADEGASFEEEETRGTDAPGSRQTADDTHDQQGPRSPSAASGAQVGVSFSSP